MNGIGSYLTTLYPDCDFPEMLWDGLPPAADLTGMESICVSNSGTLADLDLESFPFPEPGLAEASIFDCERDPLPIVVIDVPLLP